jgi:hypothetical protein
VSGVGHFLLDTPPGTLVLTVFACAIVGMVVWAAVNLAVTLLALGLWSLVQALQRLLTRRPSGWRHAFKPGAKA